jgi:hypothetical protein
MKLDMTVKKFVEKVKFYQNLTRIMGTLHEELGTFMTVSR